MNVDEKKLRDIATELRTLAKSNASNKGMANKDYIFAGALLKDAIKAGGLSSAKFVVIREAIEEEISRPLDDGDKVSGRHRNDLLLSVARNVTQWSLGGRFDSEADFLQYVADVLDTKTDTKTDTEKKPQKNPRAMTTEAWACVRIFKKAKRSGDKIPMNQVVSDYVEENGGSKTSIRRILQDHPELWKKTDTKRTKK